MFDNYIFQTFLTENRIKQSRHSTVVRHSLRLQSQEGTSCPATASLCKGYEALDTVKLLLE